MVTRDQSLANHDIERERKGCDLGGDYTFSIERSAGVKEFDNQRSADQGEKDRSNFCEGGFLASSGNHVEQHPYRRGVLENDCNRHRSLLNGEVIEVVRTGDSERADESAEDQVALGDGEKLPPMPKQKPEQQDQHGKGGAGLGDYQGRDYRLSGKQASGKNCFAEGGGCAPAEGSARDQKVSPPRMPILGRRPDWIFYFLEGFNLQASGPVRRDRSRS